MANVRGGTRGVQARSGLDPMPDRSEGYWLMRSGEVALLNMSWIAASISEG